MKAAIIIPTYNALTHSPKHFEANLRIFQHLDSHHYRILVIDSSSHDGTTDLVQRYGFECRVIPQSEFNHGGTRQLGADMCHDCEIVIYLTQDAELTGVDSIYALVDAFEDPSIAVAFGRQLPHADADYFARQNRAFNYPAESYRRDWSDRNHYGVKTIFCSDSFAAYRRNVLNQVGGFPSDVIVSEDMFVAAKIVKVGYGLAYVATATCHHSHNYGYAQEFKRAFDIGVFFTQAAWIPETYGHAEKEGKKAVRDFALKTLCQRPWLIPSLVMRIALRLLGYKLGMRHAQIAKKWCRKLSAQPQFWV